MAAIVDLRAMVEADRATAAERRIVLLAMVAEQVTAVDTAVAVRVILLVVEEEAVIQAAEVVAEAAIRPVVVTTKPQQNGFTGRTS
jgi:hypothetical protein